jgi:hypothetical protein
VLTALLAAALLLAVAAGLRHRIAHAWPDSARDGAAAHHCQAYDAATLAERLPAAPLAAPPSPPRARPQRDSAPAAPGRPASPPYLPRGPPPLALP